MPSTRNTPQRKLILEAVQAMHNHPTAEEVYLAIVQKKPSISKATVYRNLALLAETGTIRRVSHLDAADRFDYKTTPHYHFRCSVCDSVFDVTLPEQKNLLAQVKSQNGFAFDGYDITFYGRCPHCQ